MYSSQYTTTVQGAKQTAKKLFQKYCYSGSQVGHYEVSSMVRDVYSNINKNFNPSNQDVKGFQRGLDFNNDGKVTLEDFEAKCIKYLCGEQALGSLSQKQQPRYTQVIKNNLISAKNIFERYQVGNKISFQESFYVLTETYELLGRKGYQPSEQDIRVWIKLCDGDNDGKVIYQQYEQFVLRSFQRAGMKLYDQ